MRQEGVGPPCTIRVRGKVLGTFTLSVHLPVCERLYSGKEERAVEMHRKHNGQVGQAGVHERPPGKKKKMGYSGIREAQDEKLEQRPGGDRQSEVGVVYQVAMGSCHASLNGLTGCGRGVPRRVGGRRGWRQGSSQEP